MSGLGWPAEGVLPRGFGSPTHGPTSCGPIKRLPHVGEGLRRREQYLPLGSAQRGNPCLPEVSHSSPLGGCKCGPSLHFWTPLPPPVEVGRRPLGRGGSFFREGGLPAEEGFSKGLASRC